MAALCLLGVAIGMSVLMVNTVQRFDGEVGKIIGIAASILLTGFSCDPQLFRPTQT